ILCISSHMTLSIKLIQDKTNKAMFHKIILHENAFLSVYSNCFIPQALITSTCNIHAIILKMQAGHNGTLRKTPNCNVFTQRMCLPSHKRPGKYFNAMQTHNTLCTCSTSLLKRE
ncbi:unnamed protein product, partial [Owenia fusiformis]